MEILKKVMINILLLIKYILICISEIYFLKIILKGKFFGVNPFIADLSYEYSTKAKTDCHIIYCSK